MNTENEIDVEDIAELLRWASAQGQKRRKSIPTVGDLIGIVQREKSLETRYSFASANGHPYLRIQEFQFDVRDGSWTPVKGRCFTVRIHELEAVQGFLETALELAATQARENLQS